MTQGGDAGGQWGKGRRERREGVGTVVGGVAALKKKRKIFDGGDLLQEVRTDGLPMKANGTRTHEHAEAEEHVHDHDTKEPGIDGLDRAEGCIEAHGARKWRCLSWMLTARRVTRQIFLEVVE